MRTATMLTNLNCPNNTIFDPDNAKLTTSFNLESFQVAYIEHSHTSQTVCKSNANYTSCLLYTSDAADE